jgi:hypothetical protein
MQTVLSGCKVGCNAARLWYALPSCALATLLAPAAHADPPPAVSHIAWSDDGQGAVLVTNRGLIFSDAAATQFRLMCNQAVGVGIGDPPSVAYLGAGRWIAATTGGLKSSADGGCSWQGVEPLSALQTPALVQHPTERETLYVAVYAPSQGGIRVTRDAGQNFSTLLSLQDNEFTHSLAVAPSDPQRVYAAGMAFDTTGNFTHYLLRSPDGGTSWERFNVALGELDERASLVAVHPTNADEILLKTTSLTPDQPERVLLSRDGGENFTVAFQGWRLSDASYVKLGSEVWVASVEGLWRSTDVLAGFEKQGIAQYMSSVTEHEGVLWASGMFAGTSAGDDGVGISSNGGQAFEPWMQFRDVDEPVACAPEAPTAVACETAWPHWQFEVLGLSGDAATGSGGSAGNVSSGGAGGDWRDAAASGATGGAHDTTARDGGGCSFARQRGQHSTQATFLAATALGLSCARRAFSRSRRTNRTHRATRRSPLILGRISHASI